LPDGGSRISATSGSALREEQLAALGSVDLLFVPVGGGPTIGAEQARVQEVIALVGLSEVARKRAGGLLAGDGPARRYRRRSAWRSGDADP